MLSPARGGPSSSPSEPQAASSSTSSTASRVMTICNGIIIYHNFQEKQNRPHIIATKVFNLFALPGSPFMNILSVYPFYSSNTKQMRANTQYTIPTVETQRFFSCLVALWSSWRDCCLIFAFFRCAPFGAKTGGCMYPFWAKPLLYISLYILSFFRLVSLDGD